MAKYEFFTVYFNLVKTIIGCGMLAYPNLFLTYGWIPVLLLTTTSAFFSATGLLIYTECNRVIGKKSNMSSISAYIIPKLKICIDVCVSVKCFGVGVVYICILNENVLILIAYLSKFVTIKKYIPNQKIFLLFLHVLFAPLSFFGELSKLRFASFFGIMLIFVIFIFNIYTYKNTVDVYSVPMYTEKKDYIKNLGQFVYGYTCHQNIFTIQNEMKNKNPILLTNIILASLLSTLTMYVFFGVINLKIFGTECKSDILTKYAKNNDITSFLIILSYSIMILLSFPFQSVPCRLYTLNLFPRYANNKIYNQLFTFCLLVTTYLIASSGKNVKSLFNFIGGSVSAYMCFFFGPMFYFKLKNQKIHYRIFAILTILFGLIVNLGFIYDVIQRVINAI